MPVTATTSPSARRARSPKHRLDRAADALFARHGIRSVGVDTIVARSGVAKMTLYRHYGSKDALALGFLERRWNGFSRGWQAELEALKLPPRAALLKVFDLLGRWFREPGFAGCPVVKAVMETAAERRSPVRRGAVRYLAGVRGYLRSLARDADVRDPAAFAARWQLLVWGAIVGASAGDRHADRRAKDLGRALLATEHSKR